MLKRSEILSCHFGFSQVNNSIIFCFRLQLPISDDNIINRDHNYDGNKSQIKNGVSKTFKAPSAPADNNKKVTEFFPVRRSVRKTKKEVQDERRRNIEQAIKEGREDGLAVSLEIFW